MRVFTHPRLVEILWKNIWKYSSSTADKKKTPSLCLFFPEEFFCVIYFCILSQALIFHVALATFALRLWSTEYRASFCGWWQRTPLRSCLVKLCKFIQHKIGWLARVTHPLFFFLCRSCNRQHPNKHHLPSAPAVQAITAFTVTFCIWHPDPNKREYKERVFRCSEDAVTYSGCQSRGHNMS